MVAIIFLPATAEAEEASDGEDNSFFGPARVRMIINLGLELPHELKLTGHFLPAPNLLGELTPLAYLGIHWAPINWGGFELLGGFNWGKQEGIISLRLNAQARSFWFWGDIEFSIPSGDRYYFAQFQWQPLRWLAVGGEIEGWGPLDSRGSNGGGPNILFCFPPWAQLVTTIHLREEGGELWGEFFARLVLNFVIPRREEGEEPEADRDAPGAEPEEEPSAPTTTEGRRRPFIF